MKKTFITLIAFLLASFLYAQDNYYWSAKTKHYLKQQSNLFIVKLEEDLDFANIVERLNSDSNIKELVLMKQNLAIILVESSKIDVINLKEYKEFSNAMPAYQLGEGPIFLTGEILLQPKNDIPIENILKITRYKLKEYQNIILMF